MSVKTGIFEYGKITYFSIFKFFDILKREVLDIGNMRLSRVISKLRLRIDF